MNDKPEPFVFITPRILAPEEQRPSPNRRGPRRMPIDLIVLHATAGAFEGAISWLCKADRQNPTSAHLVVAKDGRIVRLVNDEDEAWHAGNSIWQGRGALNQRSIGIEIENSNTGADPYPEVQLETVLSLCARDCRRYGLNAGNVVGHAHVAPQRKTDPAGFPWPRFYASLAAALTGIEDTPAG